MRCPDLDSTLRRLFRDRHHPLSRFLLITLELCDEAKIVSFVVAFASPVTLYARRVCISNGSEQCNERSVRSRPSDRADG